MRAVAPAPMSSATRLVFSRPDNAAPKAARPASQKPAARPGAASADSKGAALSGKRCIRRATTIPQARGPWPAASRSSAASGRSSSAVQRWRSHSCNCPSWLRANANPDTIGTNSATGMPAACQQVGAASCNAACNTDEASGHNSELASSVICRTAGREVLPCAAATSASTSAIRPDGAADRTSETSGAIAALLTNGPPARQADASTMR